ncbi:MAG: CDP-alcohol phosphatidyltransferase family protein [Thaumarchaeota archaeon]|nr:MAG: CDP-alcohol phosphatidyltransferase family protein [Candidatus Wolframiiraptor sp.]RLG07041.1 MAG: CDP-alcohol phosphatidyltransferase family protein [Nitrososphaerota archaeon]HDD40458.1 CDP-alcohol phosphatidyltransferase family protein [Nitrososphaeria archaeon]
MGTRKRKLEEAVFEKLSMRLIDFLAIKRVKPIFITLMAFAAALASSVFYYLAGSNSTYYFPATFLLAFSGFLDAMDGAVARKLGLTSDMGAFLDSVLDKFGECAVYIAIISSGAVNVFWGSLALASSIMVSYVRHRAEPLKVDLKGVGFMERAERLVFLMAASILTPFYDKALEIAMILIGIFALLTTIWRMVYIVQILKLRKSR